LQWNTFRALIDHRPISVEHGRLDQRNQRQARALHPEQVRGEVLRIGSRTRDARGAQLLGGRRDGVPQRLSAHEYQRVTPLLDRE
jgi:hypothetical protein